MELGLAIDPARSWDEVRQLASFVDEAAWRGVYLCDHFVPHADTSEPAPADPVLEGWTTLSGLSQQTRKVRLGSLVLGNTYRHPAVVANMAATLDQLSGGRCLLGVGAGWQANEHLSLGIALPPVSARLDAFEEACQIICSLLREDRTTFDGRWYTIVDAPCEPKPIQPRLPLLIGGSGERRMLAVVARWADEWHTWATSDEYLRKREALDRHCAAAGRDPSTIRRLVGGVLPLELGGSWLDEVASQWAAFAEAGAQEYVVRDHRDFSLAETLQALEQLTRLRAQ